MGFGNAYCGIQVGVPSLSLITYLSLSVPGIVFFLMETGPSKVRKKRSSTPSEEFLINCLPDSHPHIMPTHPTAQIYTPFCAHTCRS
jgi:hypothetical protein